MKDDIKLFLVMPCYNEEDILLSSAEKTLDLFRRLMDASEINIDSRILFVDDGSSDRTWDIITELHQGNSQYSGIRLSKNKGHQIAIYAGMMHSYEQGADCVITIDSDLQQDIEAVPRFIEKYNRGCDIVYGVRNSRDTDSIFKKSTATFYYKLMNMLGCDLIENSADYRLISRRALNALSQYKETNIFLRGLVTEMGFKSDIVYFDVSERKAGVSKYTLSKMLSLAMSGITSFSIKPIRIATLLCGTVALFISFIMIICTLIDYFRGNTVQGWSTIVISMWFLGSLQLFALGVIGEYVGRTYIESKKRPRFFIIEDTDNEKAV